LINRSLRVLLALTIPASILIALVIRPLVDLFGCDAYGTELVIWTARAFLLGLAGHSLLEVAVRGYYAQQDAITPLWASALMAATFTILAIFFSRSIGASGIALSNALAFTGEALLLLYLLNRRFSGLLRLRKTLLRATLASLVAGLLVYLLLSLNIPVPSLLQAMGALGLGGLVVLPFIWPEIKLLLKL